MFESLVSWVEGHGAVLNHIEPALTQEGWRGIVTTEDIQENEVILKVPASILMSTKSARVCPVLGPILERHTLSEKQVLCVHLLREMSLKDSRFRTYLDHLPRSYNLLESWTDAEAQRLCVQDAIDECREAMRELEEEWAACRSALRDAVPDAPKWRSKPAWAWASGTVMSRTMYVPWDGVGCLTPLGDFHNYRSPPAPFTAYVEASLFPEPEPEEAEEAEAEATASPTADEAPPVEEVGALSLGERGPSSATSGGWGDGSLNESTQMYEITARRSYSAGEQVFLCYGKYTNLELLKTYGFLLIEGNPHDQVRVPLDLLLQGAPRHAREFIEGQDPEDFHICADGEPSWHLLQALRARYADQQTFRRFRQRTFVEGKRLSAQGDREAMNRLIDIATALFAPVKAAETALPPLETPATPSADGGPSNAELADAFRLSYMRVLKKCAEKANERLNRLTALET